jgi:hypothetical protein
MVSVYSSIGLHQCLASLCVSFKRAAGFTSSAAVTLWVSIVATHGLRDFQHLFSKYRRVVNTTSH